MSRIMVQATSSNAGKTTIAALLCAHRHAQGRDVAPFKTLNISLNSYVTKEGGEIAISQAFQSWACGLEPETDMNPILLKPKGDGMQLVLQGRPFMDVGKGIPVPREEVFAAAMRSHDAMASRHEDLIIEGSGSPAEINLRKQDIANMRTAAHSRAPVILVGDIERGGVFAALYGTYELLEEKHKPLVKGFLINRFRGEESILLTGIQRLEREMGVPCLGVMPYLRLALPGEDALDLGRGTRAAGGGDVREVWQRSLQEMLNVSRQHVRFDLIDDIMKKGC
jgi:adenosylcobyric acid synthase